MPGGLPERIVSRAISGSPSLLAQPPSSTRFSSTPRIHSCSSGETQPMRSRAASGWWRVTVPCEVGTSSMSTRASDDFPAPLGPRMAQLSPVRIAQDVPDRMNRSRTRTVTFSSVMKGSPGEGRRLALAPPEDADGIIINFSQKNLKVRSRFQVVAVPDRVGVHVVEAPLLRPCVESEAGHVQPDPFFGVQQPAALLEERHKVALDGIADPHTVAQRLVDPPPAVVSEFLFHQLQGEFRKRHVLLPSSALYHNSPV